MKQYLLINIVLEKNSIVEELMDNTVLKEIAYGAKFKDPTLEYDNVLIPLICLDETDQGYILDNGKIKTRVIQQPGIMYSDDTYYSLYNVLSPMLTKSKVSTITIIDCIEEDKINIFYTDGSFSKNGDKAAYACCKLLEESATGLYDDFTGRNFNFDAFSGKIDNGTNNIGELTAIKIAMENFGEKKYQMIISDSIYGIKSYREWIYNWKKNGYKAASNKPIKNKELITETFGILQKQQDSKIVMMKWTKGHANNSFNEKCDEMAKKELGIE